MLIMESPKKGGKASKSKVIPHCTWKKVIPAVSLQTKVEKGRTFRILFYELNDPSRFNVIDTDMKDGAMDRLREKIAAVVEAGGGDDDDDDDGLKLEEDPYIGEVVLVPNPGKSNEYQRAIIEEISFAPLKLKSYDDYSRTDEKSTALVYFFDFGGSHEVKLKDMKPVTRAIMKFPVMTYKIALFTKERYGKGDDHIPFSGEGMIWNRDLQRLMERVVKRVNLTLDLNIEATTLPMYHVTDLFNIYPASVRYINTIFNVFRMRGPPNLTPILLTAQLSKLKLWEWERFWSSSTTGNKFNVTDKYLQKQGAYGGVMRAIRAFQPELGTEFTAQITTIGRSPSGKFCELRVILLNDPAHMNHVTVLRNQLERYGKLVAGSWLDPAAVANDETFMFKVEKKKKYFGKGIRRLGEWCRAVKVDKDWIYLFDWDNYVDLRSLGETMDYHLRPLYGEFLKVPCLTTVLSPLEDDVPIAYRKGLDLFKPGNRYRFRVEHAHPDNGVHEVTCLGLTRPNDKVFWYSDSDTTSTSSDSD